MKHVHETEGLVLFARTHREKDKLVKIFTESYGKRMFFVKRAMRPNNPLTPALMPFTKAVYIGDIRDDGLSFLNAVKHIEGFQVIQQDIFISAYATYMLNLVDAAIEDRVYDPALYGFTKQALTALNNQIDPEIITNIFEIQLLNRFGVAIDWSGCRICGETQGKFDFSPAYNGLLCEQHIYKDDHRLHADPKAIHFLRMFSQISYEQINQITMKESTKQLIRHVIDELYDEYVGLHLKSKKFIDDMKSWEDTLKNKNNMPDSRD
ncbi:DNA repair protein RecO [Vagococcus acidifermentans]|uniref:DNA repair protein RecO n=1 Tax=Vagococcus acidifermentans TaxID=564710 RepID=A0A430AY30_9ENTE|nr:DNA repair protein RecO [Vagococcus acidifermentans]RSU12967.1 DNA repair protein RecO [Vagococcus acidifermentans]